MINDKIILFNNLAMYRALIGEAIFFSIFLLLIFLVLKKNFSNKFAIYLLVFWWIYSGISNYIFCFHPYELHYFSFWYLYILQGLILAYVFIIKKEKLLFKNNNILHLISFTIFLVVYYFLGRLILIRVDLVRMINALFKDFSIELLVFTLMIFTLTGIKKTPKILWVIPIILFILFLRGILFFYVYSV